MVQAKVTHNLASTIHDHTYGITSDPLTQFACVFAALIHDVDHTGLPNIQLVKEKTALASAYNGKVLPNSTPWMIASLPFVASFTRTLMSSSTSASSLSTQ
jgi:hypothetical protein